MTEQQDFGTAQQGQAATAAEPPEIYWSDDWGAFYRERNGVFEFHEGPQRLVPDQTSAGWAAQDAFTARRQNAAALQDRMADQTRRPAGAPDPDADYSLKAMSADPHYVGENTRLQNVEGEMRATAYQVKYHTAETAKYRAITQEQYSEPHPDDPSVEVTKAKMLAGDEEVEDGEFGWVLDSSENLFLFDPDVEYAFLFDDKGAVAGQKPIRGLTARGLADLYDKGYQIQRHSTQAGGQPVIGAGMLTVEDGRISLLTDQSGHYKPFMANISNAASVLVGKGFMDGSTSVLITGQLNDPLGRPIGKAWVGDLAAQNPLISTDSIVVPERVLELDQDEVHLRQHSALMAELKSKTGAESAPEEAEEAEESQYLNLLPEDQGLRGDDLVMNDAGYMVPRSSLQQEQAADPGAAGADADALRGDEFDLQDNSAAYSGSQVYEEDSDYSSDEDESGDGQYEEDTTGQYEEDTTGQYEYDSSQEEEEEEEDSSGEYDSDEDDDDSNG